MAELSPIEAWQRVVGYASSDEATVSTVTADLIQRNARHQFFFEETVWPEDGTIEVPDRPGIGTTIDESRVEAERELTLD